ncbi:response regulator [Permianibacter sp. IMCC34836]|uniref:response regulator n=1 Tax=Permianibacter fluminis TaxID=2738515 RepID=UPI0015517419|nr:HD domain-containing phosphohydrolase [Permianibacter fluminis]NQD36156.1 response regulator [Permianibacter fluminis]
MSQQLSAPSPGPSVIRVMIVDDAPENLLLLQDMLSQHGCEVVAFASGAQALKAAKLEPPDLILLDITMPEMDGYQVCETLRAHPRLANTPVIFLSALGSTEDKVRAFQAGGVDYITKPFQFEEVQARINTHFRLHQLQMQLEFQNQHLQELVEAKAKQLSESQLATIFALAKLADSRDGELSFRLDQIRLYCKLIAETLRLGSPYADEINPEFVTLIQHAAPLHDIGEVVVPEAVLLKPGKLTPEEWQVMKSHAEIGERTLNSIAAYHQDNAFIRMGIEIAGGHHERWDGSGYPRGLAGTDIPLSARIMAVVDVYAALRSTRSYRTELSHADAVATITAAAGSQFDPIVVAAFVELAPQFERIHAGL